MSHFLSFVLISLVFDCVVGPVIAKYSFLSRVPKEIVHKIANDYVANQEHLIHFSQISREHRAIADQVDLERINQDYASIINTTMNASQISSTFYHLKRVKTIKEFANTSLPCIFRGVLSHTTGNYTLESQGNYTKIFEAIMNGSKVMDELMLFNKPWTREPAPFGVLLLYFQEVAFQPSVITMYLGLIICITTAIILMNVHIIRMRRG